MKITNAVLGKKKSPAKTAAARRNAKLPRSEQGLEKFIRDPQVIWYGPHQCDRCGGMVVKSSFESGGIQLDAADHNHHYPNFQWQKHVCQSTLPPNIPSEDQEAVDALLMMRKGLREIDQSNNSGNPDP